MPNTAREDGSGTAPEESKEIVQFDASRGAYGSEMPTEKSLPLVKYMLVDPPRVDALGVCVELVEITVAGS